eukprot:TRINITY_DN5882_c0_g1::TRINITY_DN5882_c0_g1_i1::g.24427::m.24427 TRINITY_DN5882_c0_g1::TRINITY_DN5882_c0_g1_i1::g.24427  ORF type:complete len:227 (+),score=-10.44,F-box-like/PF12937.2/1.2e-07,F-box/PF00646.28/1.4e-05,F-box/PF00646.28/9.3e+03 TRINITY_DN5882_c0_g1_i1:113-793(+)
MNCCPFGRVSRKPIPVPPLQLQAASESAAAILPTHEDSQKSLTDRLLETIKPYRKDKERKNVERGECCFHLMPTDILALIFRQLDLHEIYALALVCKAWRPPAQSLLKHIRTKTLNAPDCINCSKPVYSGILYQSRHYHSICIGTCENCRSFFKGNSKMFLLDFRGSLCEACISSTNAGDYYSEGDNLYEWCSGHFNGREWVDGNWVARGKAYTLFSYRPYENDDV